MKRKLLTVILSFTMVFTMAVPAFAGTESSQKCKPVYVAYGDSVGSGYNLYGYNIDRYIDDGHKNSSFTVAPQAFPSLVAKRIGGINEEKSYNASFPGTRPEEYCYILGLIPQTDYYQFNEITEPVDGKATFKTNRENLVKKAIESANAKTIGYKIEDIIVSDGEEEKSYSYYFFFQDGDEQVIFVDDSQAIIQTFMNFTSGYLEAMKNPVNSDSLKKSIKQADLITVELGMNDITAILVDDYEPMLTAIYGAIDDMGMSGDTKGIGKIKKLLEEYKAASDCVTRAQKLSDLIVEAGKLGVNVSKALKQVDDIFMKHIDEAKKYLKILIGYMRAVNPDAHIILTNMYNPIAGMDLGEYTDAFNLLIETYGKKMNSNYRKLALKYNCTVADITDVVPVYDVHPDAAGQAKIADAIIKAIKKDCLKRGNSLGAIIVAKKNSKACNTVCEHANLDITVDAEEATFLKDGYTGDTYCKDCGEKLAEGSVINMLVPDKTKIKSLSALNDGFKVKWNKKADLNGYEIQYSTTKKFTKKVKTVTVNKSSVVSKTIKKLKSNKKYYVRVRTIKVVDENNTVYSAWTGTRSVTTK